MSFMTFLTTYIFNIPFVHRSKINICTTFIFNHFKLDKYIIMKPHGKINFNIFKSFIQIK